MLAYVKIVGVVESTNIGLYIDRFGKVTVSVYSSLLYIGVPFLAFNNLGHAF